MAKKLQRISKTQARKLFNEGKSIFFLPSRIPVNTLWYTPEGLNKADFKEGDERFDCLCNSYRFYNCNDEAGRFVKFYIEVA